jgi:hypothetical protein
MGAESLRLRFSKKSLWDLSAVSPVYPILHQRRTFTARQQPQLLAREAARTREKTEAFKKQYAHRAGIEGTISLGVRTFDLRRTRYLGLAKTHLHHIWSLLRLISRAWPIGSEGMSPHKHMPLTLRFCFRLFQLSSWVRQQDHELRVDPRK